MENDIVVALVKSIEEILGRDALEVDESIKARLCVEHVLSALEYGDIFEDKMIVPVEPIECMLKAGYETLKKFYPSEGNAIGQYKIYEDMVGSLRRDKGSKGEKVKASCNVEGSKARFISVEDGNLDFNVLRVAVSVRDEERFGSVKPDLSFRVMEFAGECGDVLSLMKKNGETMDVEKIGEDIADIVLSIDTLSMSLGVNLSSVVVKRFNENGKKFGFQAKLVSR